ncbi:MAG TPA: hypothetical protein VGP04_18340, partial [Pseudonocardiaceae bacterium]|nr:hypothetical protein [Pseudonocardiaceae bacterium]
DLRPLKPRRFGDGGLMVTVTGFQSMTAGSPACCEGIDALSEQLSSCDDEDQRQPDRQRAACRQPRSGGHRAGRRPGHHRTDNPHLVFGHGIHHCRGAPLAQLESRIALGSLPSRFPQLGLAVPAEQLMYRPGVLMNGLTTLPVILR